MKLTDAQKRALLWLPKDGGWREKPGRISAALNSLSVRHGDFLEIEACGFVGLRGAYIYRFRLTPAGIAAREALEKRDD